MVKSPVKPRPQLALPVRFDASRVEPLGVNDLWI